MSKHLQRTAWTVIVLTAIGCNPASDTGDSGGANMDELANMLDRQAVAANEEKPADSPPAVQQQPTDVAAAEPAPPAEEAAAPAAEPAPAEPQYTEAEVVTARDPQRGRVFHNQPGYFNVLFSARFVAENKMTFAKVTHALDLYEADNNGRKPKSHEEFMEKIIEPNMIELPPLRDNYEYWYNAEEGILMMRKPIEEGNGQ